MPANTISRFAPALAAIAEEAVKNAEELARLTENVARTGGGLQADADRALTELHSRRQDLTAVKEQAAVASAELARILRLDPATAPVPFHLFETGTDVYALIAQAQVVRPELVSARASVQEPWFRIRQERLRPWVPTLYAGVSGGGFGGSPGGTIDGFGGRTDFDLAVFWEARNLGLGNGARRREQESLHRQTDPLAVLYALRHGPLSDAVASPLPSSSLPSPAMAGMAGISQRASRDN